MLSVYSTAEETKIWPFMGIKKTNDDFWGWKLLKIAYCLIIEEYVAMKHGAEKKKVKNKT